MEPERMQRVNELARILAKGDWDFGLSFLCDLACDDREAGNHSYARKSISLACDLVRAHPEVNISKCHFARDTDCHRVFKAWSFAQLANPTNQSEPEHMRIARRIEDEKAGRIDWEAEEELENRLEDLFANADWNNALTSLL